MSRKKAFSSEGHVTEYSHHILSFTPNEFQHINFDISELQIIKEPKVKFFTRPITNTYYTLEDVRKTFTTSNLFGVNKFACGISITFEIQLTITKLTIQPITIYEVMGRIGGFASLIFAFRFLLLYYNKRKLIGDQSLDLQDIRDLRLRVKQLEAKNEKREELVSILFHTDDFFIPM